MHVAQRFEGLLEMYRHPDGSRWTGQQLDEGSIHTTGHGVGLDIHKAPRVGPQDEELLAGEVVSVEPGVYLPNAGGVRIEALAVVIEDGHRNLTEFPKRPEVKKGST